MSDPTASCSQAAKQFSETTTLHGFKYLTSKYYYDRWGWLVCCCASAGCAGVLCAVLWARFLQVPALLTLRELRAQQASMHMPLVAVCLPAETIAQLFGQHLITNEPEIARLPEILDHVLRRKYTAANQLQTLEDILNRNNLSLTGALMKVMPACHALLMNCRWQSMRVPCDTLFEKELTQWGPCCLSKHSKLKVEPALYTRLGLTRRLNFAMQCSDKPMLHGCEFFTKYNGEEWVEPTPLTPGHNYIAQVSFTSVVDSDPEKLVDETCVASDDYSTSQCLLKCREKSCGCSDPMRYNETDDRNELPPCPITKLNCLRSFRQENVICKCLPSCKKVTTHLALESSRMNAFTYTFDDIYTGLNMSTSSVLNIIIRIMGSKVFVVNPTETWITLLSSLGGVFNMFLGVGLFSALEILFLIFIRCPIAIRKSSETTFTRDVTT